MDLETDPNKFMKKVISLRNTLSSSFNGPQDFHITELMTSEYDLKYASKNLKFALVPKVT